jgi:hypothetical protein
MSRPHFPHRYVKLPLPGGKVVYLTEESYTLFCGKVQELVRCMEQAEYAEEIPLGGRIVINRPMSQWPKVLWALLPSGERHR